MPSPNKSFSHNKIPWSPVFTGRHARHKGPINCSLEYYHPACRWFCNPQELLSRIRFEGVEYRQIPEFPVYYVSMHGQLLSLASSGIRKLTPQYIRHSSGSVYGPIARMRKEKGHCYTRSVVKIVRDIWGD